MDLIFTNIPSKTKNEELYDFVIKSVTSWWVKGVDQEITRSEVLRITDQETSGIEYYGLVSIKSQVMGERVLEKLNGQLFKDTEIEVREYSHRVPGDRRFKDECLWVSRPTDRRRKNLKVERQRRKKKDVAKDWFKKGGR